MLKRKFNRRDFIGKTAAGIVAIAVTGSKANGSSIKASS
jgi:hypothetical protein